MDIGKLKGVPCSLLIVEQKSSPFLPVFLNLVGFPASDCMSVNWRLCLNFLRNRKNILWLLKRNDLVICGFSQLWNLLVLWTSKMQHCPFYVDWTLGTSVFSEKWNGWTFPPTCFVLIWLQKTEPDFQESRTVKGSLGYCWEPGKVAEAGLCINVEIRPARKGGQIQNGGTWGKPKISDIILCKRSLKIGLLNNMFTTHYYSPDEFLPLCTCSVVGLLKIVIIQGFCRRPIILRIAGY